MTGEPVSIVPARQDDLAQILALEQASFAEPERWSERSWQGELLGQGRTTLLARAQHLLGAVALQTTDRTADLLRLLVAPEHRRRGVAVQLVRAGLDAVRHAGATRVLLEVEITNDPAIRLYQRVGFEQLAARQDYYGPGRHALILKLWDLPSWPRVTDRL